MATGLTERERELRTKRAEIWEGMKPLVEKAGRGETLTVEERTEYDKRDSELEAATSELRTVESMAKRNTAEREAADTRGLSTDEAKTRDEREMAAFSAYLRHGEEGLAEYRTGPGGDTSPLQVSPGSQGGYTVPQGFWHNLQVALKEYGGTFPLYRQVVTDSGNPMPWPTTDPTSIVASLLTENTQVSPQDVTFGQGMMNAYTYVAGPFFASIQVVNDSAFDVDTFLRDRIGEAIGRSQAAAARTGTGSSQPLGVETALASVGSPGVGKGGLYVPTAGKKVPTLGDTAAASTNLSKGVIDFQDILNIITYVDPAYRKAGNTSWVMSDNDLQKLRTLTSTTGHPLWEPSVQVGGTNSDNLYGYPVAIDNNGTSIPTAANTQGGPIFGSLEHAMVARTVRQVGVLRLVERYADFLAVAWLGYMRYDIRSNDLRAVAGFKSAAT